MPGDTAGPIDELASVLSAELLAATFAGLSDEERVDVQALPPPELSTKADADGSWLVIEWGGSSQAHGWDGSEADALEIVRSAGPAFAENLSADFWVSGGWRDHQEQGEGFQSG